MERVKPVFAVAFLIVWNVLMATGIVLNGGLGPVRDFRALAIAGVATLAAGALAVLVLVSAWFRGLVLREGTTLDEVRRDFRVLAGVCLFLGVMCFLALARGLSLAEQSGGRLWGVEGVGAAPSGVGADAATATGKTTIRIALTRVPVVDEEGALRTRGIL